MPMSVEETSLLADFGDVIDVLPGTKPDEDDDEIQGIPCEVTDESVLASIQRNLGYIPTNLVRVAAMYTTKDNQVEPGVLLLYPLRNCIDDYKAHHRKLAEPFPTIYWLANAELHERVSALEAEGLVNQFTDRLVENAEYVEAMKRMHEEYAEERWAMLTEADRALVEKKRWVRALRSVGIAGIRNAASVKCLHTHYAHYLATKNNLIGEWVHDQLQLMK